MDDFSFVSLDEEEAVLRSKENAAPSTSQEKSVRDAMISYSQRIQRTQSSNADRGDYVEPENDFEKELETYKCSLRRDSTDKMQISIDDGSFSQLVQTFNQRLANREAQRRIMEALEKAVSGSRSKLLLYLTPCNSPKGIQETIFRALLICSHTQNKAFDILLTEMNRLAKREEEESTKLSVACVNQMRWIPKIFNSETMLQAVFDRSIEEWNPATRDYFLEALPEVLTTPACQQEAAVTLRDMIMHRTSKEPLSYQSAIIGALKLLRMDGAAVRGIRRDLCLSIMLFEAPVVPEVVSFCLKSLSIDEKHSLRTVLAEICSHLKLASLRVDRASRRVTVDDIFLDMFSKICRFVQLEGQKGWKEITSFLRTQEVSDQRPDNGEETRALQYFDVLLIFSLMSIDGCPPSIVNQFKNQVVDHPDRFEDLADCVNFSLKHKKIASRYLPSLTYLAQQCLWSPNELVRSLGAVIYRNLFVTVREARKDVLRSMLNHVSASSGEAETIFVILEELVTNHFEELSEFARELTNCLDHLGILSLNNVRRLFSILILVYSSDSGNTEIERIVNECISKFLCSLNEKEQIWGVLGMLMQLQRRLSDLSSPTNREAEIKKLLELLKEKCNSARLRSVMYLELATILHDNIHNKRSHALLQWVERLFHSFRTDFFITRNNYDSLHDLEDKRYANTECTLWLNTASSRLIELVPLFKLLCGAAFLKQRWTHDDDTQQAFNLHFTHLFFAFEANISLDSIIKGNDASPQDLQRSADVLYLVVEWIREVLNTFSTCTSVDGIEADDMVALWVRKFRLLFECQETLIEVVKKAQEWQLPVVSSHVDKVLVLAEKPLKRPKRAAPKKKTKRKKGDPAETEVKEEPRDENDDGEHEEDRRTESERPQNISLVLKKCEKIQITALAARYQQLKLATVVRCLEYIQDKRRTTCFLIQEFLKILKVVLTKKTAKTPFFAKSSRGKVDPKFHGDAATTWKLVIKGLCTTWGAMDKVVNFFREDLKNSQVVERSNLRISQLSLLLKESLQAFTAVLSWDEVNEDAAGTEQMKQTRGRKRLNLMEKIEKTILKGSNPSQLIESQDEPERTLLVYLISVADVIPNIDVAVALVQTASSCSAWTDELRDTMARKTLKFLQNEWLDSEANTLKGASLNSGVRVLLEKYISFREEDHQLSCILWLLANKITDLVPDAERRKSKMDTYSDVDDPGLNEADKGELFTCFTRGTFSAVYKVLFTSLCSIVQKRLAARELAAIETADMLQKWKVAGNIFCLLGLMLRVKELRSLPVMTTAVKEGKKFLMMFAKNSSFMSLFEDGASFQTISDEVTAIIKTMQVGNRAIQNISIYAKSARSRPLLNAIPDLRAASELWMRSINTGFAKVGCQDAFLISLLKSRNMNGDLIRAEEEGEGDEGGKEDDETQRDSSEGDDDSDDSEDRGESRVF